MGKRLYSIEQVKARLDSGYRWDTSNSQSIEFSFPTNNSYIGAYPESPGFSALSAQQQVAARQAIEMWDDLIAPSFVEVANPGVGLKFANSSTGVSYAHAYMPGNNPIQGGVFFNTAYGDLMNPQVGGYSFMAYMHEIGHALGLNHPGNYNGGSPTYANNAIYKQDTHMYTIMSYFSASFTGGQWNGRYAQTPMVHDIEAIQKIYGADTTTRTDDTTYGFNVSANLNYIYDFTTNLSPILTIYDAGGVDTIDLSGWTTDSIVTMVGGEYSSVNGMKNNLAISLNTVIENLVTGDGNDRITGNSIDNIITSNAGNDWISGMLGNDTISSGDGDDTVFGGHGDDNIDGGAGNDTLRGDLNNDTIDGGDGNDLVFGGSGDDVLLGSAGIDTLRGEAGNDTANGGDDGDFIYMSAGNDTAYGGAGDDLVRGEAGNDSLYGDDGIDTLFGDAGNDVLYGGAGDDILNGGAGNDTYYLSTYDDNIVELARGGTDTIVLSETVNFTIINNVENVIYSGGSTTINGNALNNIIKTADGDDVLFGDIGNDRLDSGLGTDTLTGGSGVDIFVLANPTSATDYDIITDFTDRSDRISLANVKAELGYVGINMLADGYIKIEQGNGCLNIMLDADGNGANTDLQLLCELQGNLLLTNITAADFTYV